jgi:hypothetical protein
MSFRPLFGSLLVGFVLAFGATAEALGQSAGLDRTIISASGALNDGQKTSVSTFVGRHAEAIRSADEARAVEEARDALASPARDPAATPSFRKAYGAALLAELTPVVKGSDLHRALNAMQALRFSRTPEALDAILERTAVANESNSAKRIAAASLAADAFEDLDASNAYFETAARRLRDAAVGETDWLALQQKLAAIGTAARRKELPAENARNVRKSQAEAIASIAKAMRASSTAEPRMQAIQRTLVGLRNDLLVMQSADRSAVAKVLAPALSDLIACANAQWDAAQADATLSASYASALNNCEVLLRLIDRGERPQAYAGTKPEGDARVLGPSWESKDKAKFEAEATRWAGIVSAAPYRN